jgi:hypothetical protein
VTEERVDRRVWFLSLLVVSGSLATYLGLVVPHVSRSEWIGASIEILAISGIALFLICAKTRTRLVNSPSYRFIVVWGVSLPLVVTYLRLIGERDTIALLVNVLLVVLAIVWANWALAALARKRTLVPLMGLTLMTVGALLFIWFWGSLTLGDWPMMPYLPYMIDQPSIYFGLLIFAAGLVLWICGAELLDVRRLPGTMLSGLLGNLKLVASLALMILVAVGVFGVHVVVRVPFPKEVSRVDSTGIGVLHLIGEVEQLDLGSMLGRTADDGFPPWYISGGVLDALSRRRWRFKVRTPNRPGFRENGWLKYKARVERFDGWVERKGVNVTVRTGDGSLLVGRAPMTYWYTGDESTRILEGFVVIMELSYMEIYGNLGAKGFSVGPQYAFFDHEERLVAVLTPDRVGMIMA